MTDAPPLALLRDGPGDGEGLTVVLAHGAGQPASSPFMQAVAAGLAERGIAVVRFDFPYMRRSLAEGRRRPPDRQPVLLDTWREVVAACGGGERLVIGGKSMGGRMASLVADECGVRGLVALGYPFHPPGRPERLRIDHLRDLRTRALIVQGTRDPFGGADEVPGYDLPPLIEIAWIEDGDHSLRPRKASGRTPEQNLAAAVDAVAAFVARL